MHKNKALFLDRDGVVNLERGYVYRIDDFHFQPGIFALCRAAQALDYLVIIVTNQAGIARGYYTESQFHDLTTWMTERFAEQLVDIARVYYCPYHPLHGVGEYKYDSPDRKPRPGMLLRARDDFDLDLVASALVGDKLSDIQAAEAAGVGLRILLPSEPTAVATVPGTFHTLSTLDDVRRRFFSPR